MRATWQACTRIASTSYRHGTAPRRNLAAPAAVTSPSPKSSVVRPVATGTTSRGIGFIGSGSIAQMHHRALRVLPPGRANLVAIYDTDATTASQSAAEFGCAAAPSVDAILANPAIDSVYILTHLDSHVPLAIRALQAGKHVFCEKPVAASVPELLQLKKVLQASPGQVFMPGHSYIYEPALTRAKQMIDEGEIGQLCNVAITYVIKHPEEIASKYPGVIRQILTHHSYILLYLAGAPSSLSCHKSVVTYKQYKEEEQASVLLSLPKGAQAYFHASFASDDHGADPWTTLVKVIGTHGSTRFSYKDWITTKKRSPKQIHSAFFEAYQGAITGVGHHFIENVLWRGGAPLSGLDEAIAAQRIVEASEASARQQGSGQVLKFDDLNLLTKSS